MQELLRKLLHPGVSFAGLIDLDGYCLGHLSQPGYSRPGARPEDVAVLVAALCAAVKAVGSLFNGDAPAKQIHFENAEGFIHITWVGRRHALVVHATAASPTAASPAAAIERSLAQLAPEISAILAGSPAASLLRFGDDIEIADLGGIRFD